MDPRATGGVLVLGALLFLVAAFNPSSRVFAERTPEGKLAVIESSPLLWPVSQIMFATGSLVTVAGVAMLARLYRDLAPTLAWGAIVAVLLFGAALWSWHTWQRAIRPAAFARGDWPWWPFLTYSIATQLGLLGVGIMLLRSPIADWVGWTLIVGMGLFFLLMLVLRDMPPFVYYVLTLVAGVVVIQAG